MRRLRYLRSLSPLILLVAVAGGISSCEQRERPSADVPLTRFTRADEKAVFLAGQFNDWSATATPMRRGESGMWTVDLPLPPGRYEYKFVVDGKWERDTHNPQTVADGWGGENSLVIVPPPRSPDGGAEKEQKEMARPRSVREEVRWKRIGYPEFSIPGAENRKMTARLSGGTRDSAGQREELRFDLIFSESSDQETPASLAHPEDFIVRLHLADGSIIESATPLGTGWSGVGKSGGMSMSRIHIFPWPRNAYDEGWIEWRLPDQTFWFEIPYGFTRDPTEPWPAAEPQRSDPVLAPAMSNLPPQDRLVPWLHVEYELGKIQNHWSLFAKMANPSRPAAEVTLYQAPDENMTPWIAEKPATAVQLKGHSEGARVAFRKQGRLERIDTFRIPYGGSDEGRDSGVVVLHVDDRSYEFTIPSSLFKYVHGVADYENKQRLPRGDGLFERLVRLAD